MIDYINDHQTRHTYLYYKKDNPGTGDDNDGSLISDAMRSYINATLRSNAPVVLNIWQPSTKYWPYTVGGGHFLNLSGQGEDYYSGTYQMTDPWNEWQGAPPSGKYWRSTNDLWEVMNCIGW